ncbi:hypothetical protein N0V88_005799 [Collariella sp. IMI 366227]|nr:hypothetical protein N0V88_005799 [Collariella sp. IMI 366227]
MRIRKEKPIFRGLIIAVVGNLNGSAQWTDANIARWVGLREGKFLRLGQQQAGGKSISETTSGGGDGGNNGEVTHVDSMLQRKRLNEEPYSYLKELKRECERERRRQMDLKGLEKVEKEVNPNLYHLYRDYTFFPYEVLLTRDDKEIYESNALPRLYWFVARYYKKKGDTQAKVHRPSYAPGVFAQEYELFKSFFQIKTGIPWAERLVRAGTTENLFFQCQPPEQDGTAAAFKDTGSNEQTGFKTMLTVKTFAVASNLQQQLQTFISPASTPRNSRFLGTVISSDDEMEDNDTLSFAQTTSLGADLPTPSHTPVKVRFALRA